MAFPVRPLLRLLACALLALAVFGAHSSETLGWSGQSPDAIAIDDDSAALPLPTLDAGTDDARAAEEVPVADDEPAANEELADDADTSTLYRVCRVTAYCDRGTTAAGVPSGLGQCAAPGYIPLGSVVHIPALGRSFVVTDRTHKRFRNSTIDIFIPSQQECRNFGRHFLECEVQIDPPAIRAQRLGRRR
jgi:3D (Asp-Asp-Asp) domain-containing protein